MAQVELSRTIRSKTLDNASGVKEFDAAGTMEISRALNALLADSFALYLKTKNFHWQVGGPRFRSYQMSYRLEFDEHAEQLFAATDLLVERVRAIGGRKLSLTDVGQLRRVRDHDRTYVQPTDMLAELTDDNKAMGEALHATRGLCERYRDTSTVDLLDTLIDQTEHRSWFLGAISEDEE
jgi:starvation-inducible DNA-binding protein